MSVSYETSVHPPTALRNARRAGLTILDVFDAIPWFKPAEDWVAWRTFLAAAYALPMTKQELGIYRLYTEREEPPEQECTIIELICGRRAGKTRIDSVVMGYEACYRDYEPYLAPGERAYFPIISADKKGARSSANYIKAFLSTVALEGMVSEKEIEKPASLNTKLDFLEDRVTIEIFTASYKSTRGYAIPAFLGDEIAFWSTNQDAAAPDTEIVKAVRGGMVQIPNAKTLYLSSPHGETGVLHETYSRFYGAEREDEANKHRVLVWKAPTTAMNLSKTVAIAVAEAYELDPVEADAEFGANFRASETEYVSMATLDRLTNKGSIELKPMLPQHGMPREHRIKYYGFLDSASGSGKDSFTFCVAHWDYEIHRAVQDFIMEAQPPFDPHKIVGRVCGKATEYGLKFVTGDLYADWPREVFGEHGLAYVASELITSDIYKNIIPAFNAGLVVLLDNKRMRKQFVGLQRKTADRGREIITHRKGEHDDLATSAAGALLQAFEEGRHWQAPEPEKDAPTTVKELWRREVAKMAENARVDRSAPEDDEWNT